MENKDFSVETVIEFIKKLIKLTVLDQLKWDFSRPKYDDILFSQRSVCVRSTAEIGEKKLILISKDGRYNFEVIFNEVSGFAEELPLVTDDSVQKELEELYKSIIKYSKIYDQFNALFSMMDNDKSLLP